MPGGRSHVTYWYDFHTPSAPGKHRPAEVQAAIEFDCFDNEQLREVERVAHEELILRGYHPTRMLYPTRMLSNDGER